MTEYKNGTEKQRLSAQVRAVFYEDKTVDELLIVYANNKHEREEIRMHLHLGSTCPEMSSSEKVPLDSSESWSVSCRLIIVRLMYKPHEMYGDAMRAMDAIGE